MQRAAVFFVAGAGLLGLALWMPAISDRRPTTEAHAARPDPAAAKGSPELQRLERRVRELEAALHAQQSAPPAHETAAPVAKAPATPMLSVAEQEDAIQADYDRRIDGHPDDAVWEKDVRDVASGALQDALLEGSRLAYVDCSAQACRVGIEHGRAEAREALPVALMTAFGRGHDMWGRDQLEDGRAHTTVYVTRKKLEIVQASSARAPLTLTPSPQ